MQRPNCQIGAGNKSTLIMPRGDVYLHCMKALVKTAKGSGCIEVKDIPVPKIQKTDDVLIKISAAGVCGTDIHIYHDEFPYWPPVVLGHEFSGVVTETGKEVKNFKVGDRVVGEPHLGFCGKCYLCREGHIQHCASKRSPGWGVNGAFTDFLVMPELFLHHVPDNLTDTIAALAEPSAIVVNGVIERGKAAVGDTIAIVGAGPIALLSLVAAKTVGAHRVYMAGTDADELMRFPAAKMLGVDEVINVMKTDFVFEIMERTGGIGVDLTIEASGTPAGVNASISITKKCGRIAVLGLPGEEKIPVAWGDMVKKALDISFCFSSSSSSWEKAISMLSASTFALDALISHHGIIDNWKKIFDDIETGNAIKALFIPEAEYINKKTG